VIFRIDRSDVELARFLERTTPVRLLFERGNKGFFRKEADFKRENPRFVIECYRWKKSVAITNGYKDMKRVGNKNYFTERKTI
jgi:hypothetical protein